MLSTPLSQHRGILRKARWRGHKQMCLLASCPGSAPFHATPRAALAAGAQRSKGCQVSPAIQTAVSTVLSHPCRRQRDETLIHVATFQALVCPHWEDFFLLGGASAPILGYKCLCLLGGTYCEWPAHFCRKALETLGLTYTSLFHLRHRPIWILRGHMVQT